MFFFFFFFFFNDTATTEIYTLSLHDALPICPDLRVEGDVRGGDSVDGEFIACGFTEMEEAADVVVLIVAGEKAFGFGEAELKGCERHGTSEFTSESAIAANQIPQRHHGSSASGFRGHISFPDQQVYSGEIEKKRNGGGGGLRLAARRGGRDAKAT